MSSKSVTPTWRTCFLQVMSDAGQRRAAVNPIEQQRALVKATAPGRAARPPPRRPCRGWDFRTLLYKEVLRFWKVAFQDDRRSGC